MSDGKEILQDPNAQRRISGTAAFLSPPLGSPVYYGFPLIEETATDGWLFGAITAFEESDGCEQGDGFVVAPDGSRAGIVWSVGDFETTEVCSSDERRWGVYEVAFPQRVRGVNDLVTCFRAVLPELQRIRARVVMSGEE